MIRASLTLASRPTSGTRGTSDRKDAWAASHAFQIGRLDLWEEKARARYWRSALPMYMERGFIRHDLFVDN